MAIINRFSQTFKGSVIMTGNTLGLTGGGQVTTINNFTTGLVNPPAGGTTTTYTANSSQAQLNLPPGAIVRYAELNWGGSSSNNTTTVNAGLTAIKFVTPLSQTFTIATLPATYQITGTPAQGNYTWYDNSADVTAIVAGGGSGYYRVEQIPGILSDANIGWILIVAYEKNDDPFRNINIWALNDRNPVTINVTNFRTPSTGPVDGRLIVAAGGGQSYVGGESLSFGPQGGTLVPLFGPNNPVDNFFCAQINDNLGLLNTTGTWGNANVTNFQSPQAGARYNYDITNVDASPGLTNNQTTATINLSDLGDIVVLNAFALQITLNSANITAIKTVTDDYVNINDTFNYTVFIQNTGNAVANNVVFMDTLPYGVTFNTGSVFINGMPSPLSNPNPPGFSINDIPSNSNVFISFSVTCTSLPNSGVLKNKAGIAFTFVPAIGDATIPGFFETNIVTTTVSNATLTSSKIVSANFVNIGDILTYTIPLSNIGNTTANNVIFLDTIPNNTTLISNSFTQDGTVVNESPNSPGVTLPNPIAAGSFSTVTFKVKVDTIPSPNPILNSASIRYSFTVDPSQPNALLSSTNTNIVTTQVNNANLSNSTKSVNRLYADCGDILTYLIVIPNSGNITAQNVMFFDTIPSGTAFQSGTVMINGTTMPNGDPSLGVTIPDIGPNVRATVTFKVMVQC